MSDEQAATFEVLATLLAPLSWLNPIESPRSLRLTISTDLQEASDDDVQAWRDSRLHTTTNVQQEAQDQTTSNDIDATVPVSVLPDPPAPSQAANSDISNPPPSENAEPPKEQKTWSPDYAGVEFLTISPTIIKLEDGTFVELRCDTCQGNGSWAHHKFNKGVRGFQSHFRQVHGDKTSAENVLRRCTYRVVSSQEVEQIKSGDSTIDFIRCDQKVEVGSNKEYVGNNATVGPVTTRRVGHTVETLAAAGQTQTTTPAAPKKERKKKTPAPDNSSPATPKKTSNRVRDVSAPCLSNCLIVVKTTADDGTDKYHELRCDVCGGNGSFGSGKLLEGVKGFKAHFRQIHGEQLLTANVLSRCSYREVPLQEVQEIQAGNVNIGFIRCAGSENVRPKKSYKDFNNVERT